MDTAAVAADIRRAGQDALAGTSLTIDDVTLSAAGKRRALRITVARDLDSLPADDSTSIIAPLSLDEVAEASQLLNDTVEAADVMGATGYTLEVSSPGVGRPLRTPAQFRRNVGRILEVTDTAGHSRRERLVAADPDGIRLGAENIEAVPYEHVARASVHVEFTRTAAGEEA